MFETIDDGQGAIRQLAWYIWVFLRSKGQERDALGNWLLAEQFYKYGDKPAWLWGDPNFVPFEDPNADA